MASPQNYVSRNFTVTTNYAALTVVGLNLGCIAGIQNNTAGLLSMKFNGGDGVLLLPPGGFFEPYHAILGDMLIKSAAAGDICVVG